MRYKKRFVKRIADDYLYLKYWINLLSTGYSETFLV